MIGARPAMAAATLAAVAHSRVCGAHSMVRLYTHISTRSMATRAAGKRVGRAAAAAAAPPQLRRNAKRIHEAMRATAIQSVASSLSASRPLYVVGLDINTNSTGYAVLGRDGRVVTWGAVATTEFASSDVLAIAHAVGEEMQRVRALLTAEEAVEWQVGIEDFMRMYRFGQFHNRGIFQLAQLNGVVSYACWRAFGCRPVHTHPSAARGLFGIVANTKGKASDATVKEQVMEFVLARERDSAACRQLRARHVNRFGQWTDAAFDIADAYVVAAHTRWMALQEQLQQHPELVRQFSDAYVALAVPAADAATTSKQKKAKPRAVEETALLAMGDDAKRTYLHGLFASGVADWVKEQQQTERVLTTVVLS